MLERSKWIWRSEKAGKDEYVIFSFDVEYEGGSSLMRLSADSNYNLFVNGELVSFGQYNDYEENTTYDEIDLTGILKLGKNHFEILVWYYGEANSNYSVGPAGLIFELLSDGAVIMASDENILSAYEPHYKRGRCKNITRQLGFGFEYDSFGGEPSFSRSVAIERKYPVKVRPVKRLLLGEGIEGKLCRSEGRKKYIFDLGKECVGFLRFSLNSEADSNIIISYGEHLIDGDIRRIIEERDFSVAYRSGAGENSFFNAFRRLGCRYISFEGDREFSVSSVEIVPTDYPLTELPFDAGDPLRRRIYEVCLRTLRLCMHEHYEDCPWREQSLYTMDSRNQMLSGYYAFGEYEFAKANIALFANSRTLGELLPICAPSDSSITIPSFGLHYFTAVREYLEHSGDKAFLLSIYDKLCELLSAFDRRADGGLLPEFSGECYWNFYEWREGLSYEGKNKYHLVLNTLYLRALENMAAIADILGKEDVFSERAEKLRKEIYRYFYDENTGLFILGKEEPLICELGNYLAILTGVVKGEEALCLVKRIKAAKDRIELTLSMRCFEYDALILLDKDGYKEEILSDIDRRWGKMLEEGATTFFETELGAADFNGAGSLCHGWSAIPVYYYHLLLLK